MGSSSQKGSRAGHVPDPATRYRCLPLADSLHAPTDHSTRQSSLPVDSSTDTGVDLVAGQKVTITTTGMATHNNGGVWTDPDGYYYISGVPTGERHDQRWLTQRRMHR